MDWLFANFVPNTKAKSGSMQRRDQGEYFSDIKMHNESKSQEMKKMDWLFANFLPHLPESRQSPGFHFIYEILFWNSCGVEERCLYDRDICEELEERGMLEVSPKFSS